MYYSQCTVMYNPDVTVIKNLTQLHYSKTDWSSYWHMETGAQTKNV